MGIIWRSNAAKTCCRISPCAGAHGRGKHCPDTIACLWPRSREPIVAEHPPWIVVGAFLIDRDVFLSFVDRFHVHVSLFNYGNKQFPPGRPGSDHDRICWGRQRDLYLSKDHHYGHNRLKLHHDLYNYDYLHYNVHGRVTRED
jgi:hypothetical protein